MLKLGSLFDGSGGFPLAALNVGIWPVWASEIEPFPIRVTTKRLPHVRHYGDVSCLHGDSIEPVDVITFGSPCQDLSVAGKRDGLDGGRSSLFFQAVRIIREMREATDGRYPKVCIWENVPGAFSSNGGEDFRCVIETLCKVAQESVYVPRPEKWDPAGAVMGDSWSLAWRQLDAQYFGVPQRRKRVFVVMDFTEGGTAAEILFESCGMSGDTQESEEQRQDTASTAGEGTDTAVSVYENHSADSRYRELSGVCTTLASNLGTGGNNQPLVLDHKPCLTSKGPGAVAHSDDDCYTLSKASHFTVAFKGAVAPTLAASDYKDAVAVSYAPHYIVRKLTPVECARLQGFPDWWCSDLETSKDAVTDEELTFWRGVFETHRQLVTHSAKAKTDRQILKWLSDPHTDAAEYKMWGNGVALPCVQWIMQQIVRVIGDDRESDDTHAEHV